jgi:hypothetical protein
MSVMKRPRAALLLADTVLTAMDGITVWACAHQACPCAVYYRRVEFPLSSQTLVMQEWTDSSSAVHPSPAGLAEQ